MKTTTAIISALALGLALVSCDSKDKQSAAPETATQTAVMEARFTDAAPSEYVTIEEARETPAGEKVTVKGTLLGREEIFLNKAAMFIIGDPEKIEIEENEDKPWKACCTPPDVIKVNTLTVQFVDAGGKLIPATAKGVKGLKELDEVVIAGTMDPASTMDAPVLNVDTITIVK